MKEGIETADAILSQVFPKADFEKKDKAKQDRANVEISRLKMDKMEELFVPCQPISLMIHYAKKL